MKNVVISYGNDFFLNRTAKLLAHYYNVSLIQNFVPGVLTSLIIGAIDKCFHKRALPRLKARKVSALNLESHRCWWNDFYGMICRKCVVDPDKSAQLIAEHFGKMSCRWIQNAEIFHVRSGFGQGGAIAKAKSKGMKVIVDHSIAYHKEMEEILQPEYERHKKPFTLSSGSKFWNLVVKDCEEADCIVVNSDYVKDSFIKYGFDEHKLEVVYLGVREDWFGRKKTYDLHDNQINLLFVGSFGIRKGAEYVIKAAQQLRKADVNFKIIVIGGNTELKDFQKNYNMDDFEFVGMVSYDQLVNYYSTVDAYLFPSLCEGSTRAGMEAMAAGLPVILTDNCGCPVRHMENGLIVPIKDGEAIADAVTMLYESQELRERLGRNSARTIATDYTWEKYRDNIRNIYQKFLKDEGNA